MDHDARLTLDGYLVASFFTYTVDSTFVGHHVGTTFISTFPKGSMSLPRVRVGLGLFLPGENGFGRKQVLDIPKGKGLSPNAFASLVEEKQRQLDHLPMWRDRLLLEMGYAIRATVTQPDKVANDHLFSDIPREEADHLLEKHGFYKVAIMVAHGYAQGMDKALDIIDDLRAKEHFSYLIALLAQGVPVEDLELAIQLPAEMVRELYRADAKEEAR